MTSYEVRVADPFGVNLTTIANFTDDGGAALEYVLNVGQVGVLTLTAPASVNPDVFKKDGRVSVWRTIAGRRPAMDGEAVFLIRKIEYTVNSTRVTAYHANSLLARRIVAYAAGTAYTSKSATAADNLIKTIVSENFGSGISAANRDGAETQADVSAYLSIAANLSTGASIAKAFTRRRVADVIRELCDASTTAGTYLAAEIVAPTEATLELRTYTGQRGIDHRATSGQPVILSVERGNLENPQLVLDWTDEVTFAIAGGQGEGTNRLIATASDSARMGESPFGRIEDFVDMSNVADATQLQDDADAAVRNGRRRIRFSGLLIDTPATTRGIHYDIGDIATAEFRGQQYDVRLDVIRVNISSGKVTQSVQLRSVT